jgi:HK97 family phage prohead protease
MRKYLPGAVSVLEPAQRSIGFVLSTGGVDRENDRVAAAGWQLDSYRQNPIVLWAHDSRQPPIARATGIAVVGETLKASATFADAETYPFADTVYRLLAGGFLNAASVGFVPLAYGRTTDASRPFGLDVTRQELVEFSVVPIPANPEALVEARAFGIDTDPVASWAARLIDEGDFGQALRADRLAAVVRAADPLGRRHYPVVWPKDDGGFDDAGDEAPEDAAGTGVPDPADQPPADQPPTDDEPDDGNAAEAPPWSVDPSLLSPDHLADVIAQAIAAYLATAPFATAALPSRDA